MKTKTVKFSEEQYKLLERLRAAITQHGWKAVGVESKDLPLLSVVVEHALLVLEARLPKSEPDGAYCGKLSYQGLRCLLDPGHEGDCNPWQEIDLKPRPDSLNLSKRKAPPAGQSR